MALSARVHTVSGTGTDQLYAVAKKVKVRSCCVLQLLTIPLLHLWGLSFTSLEQDRATAVCPKPLTSVMAAWPPWLLAWLCYSDCIKKCGQTLWSWQGFMEMRYKHCCHMFLLLHALPRICHKCQQVFYLDAIRNRPLHAQAIHVVLCSSVSQLLFTHKHRAYIRQSWQCCWSSLQHCRHWTMSLTHTILALSLCSQCKCLGCDAHTSIDVQLSLLD